MDQLEKKAHWEKIYHTRALNEVSWYQPVPATSLELIREFNISRSAKIIDVGGGDSLLADHLLELGYTDITVLDISGAALQRAMQRLGQKAALVKWIEADAATFEPQEQYDLWHDRAAFHFLTGETEINGYLEALRKGSSATGMLIIGTFSEAGPTRCSGIAIRQYSESSLTGRFIKWFDKIKCIPASHTTPSDTVQDFIFCSFRKRPK